MSQLCALQLRLPFDSVFVAEHPGPRCPWCGEPIDELDGLDILAGDGQQWLDWTPCCEGLRDAVGYYGWEAVMGRPLPEQLERLFALPVRELYDDGALRASLTTRLEPGPGSRGRVGGAIDRHHRHHDAPVGWRFAISVWNGHARVGVATVGRPVARLIASRHPEVWEVTRCCTWGDSRLRRNAASALYGACAREATRRGAGALITYTLASERGTSLVAAGFSPVARSRGGSWSRPSRTRTDTGPMEPKIRWQRLLAPAAARSPGRSDPASGAQERRPPCP